jgi:secondary thiamine-phosphate synthase enzyme
MGFAPKTARSAGRAAMGEVTVSTDRRTQLLDVTASIAKLVHDSGVQQGTCHLYVPHTSAGVIINENADQDVIHDLVMALERIAPKAGGYRHREGNSDAHIKTALVGTSATVFIDNGKLDLGHWQGIFFCEFDGPRIRQMRVKIVPD